MANTFDITKAKTIVVKDYKGTWSVIDTHDKYALLEHYENVMDETYDLFDNVWGDETCYLLVEKDSYIMKEFVSNKTHKKVILPYYENALGTYDDIITAIEDYYQ